MSSNDENVKLYNTFWTEKTENSNNKSKHCSQKSQEQTVKGLNQG